MQQSIPYPRVGIQLLPVCESVTLYTHTHPCIGYPPLYTVVIGSNSQGIGWCSNAIVIGPIVKALYESGCITNREALLPRGMHYALHVSHTA